MFKSAEYLGCVDEGKKVIIKIIDDNFEEQIILSSLVNGWIPQAIIDVYEKRKLDVAQALVLWLLNTSIISLPSENFENFLYNTTGKYKTEIKKLLLFI